MQSLKRFYCNHKLISGGELILEDDLSHYIKNVLRIKAGEKIRIFNEIDSEYDAEIIQISKKTVLIKVNTNTNVNNESPLNIHLGQAISRGERMDFVVQKAVELGVSIITPLFTERCNVKLNKERSHSRKMHWQQIAISACEQSGRIHIPEVNMPMELSEWLKQRNESIRFICHPGLDDKKNINNVPDNVALLIGSEGGFVEKEILLATQNSFKSLALGPRILRTETAAIAALTIIQSKWGDIREDFA